MSALLGLRVVFIFFIVACCSLRSSAQSGPSDSQYHQVRDARLCIASEFTETLDSVKTHFLCASRCTAQSRCRAFSLAHGFCQLFAFDQCSKGILTDCSCTQLGDVFVKKQSGVPPGALCPSGYADEFCGVKYRFLSNRQWGPGRALCESEPGLVIMSDVIDSAEMSHVNFMDTKWSTMGVGEFFLGGYQRPGSAESSGGWYWVACNITIDPVVWESGEPNNGGGFESENAVVKQDGRLGVSDFNEDNIYPDSVLCECVSPF